MILFGFVKDYSTCSLKNKLLRGKSRRKEMGPGAMARVGAQLDGGSV